MTEPSEDLLTAPEGVDEGSAASTAEGVGSAPAEDALGEPPQREPESEASPAPPVDMESAQSRAARGSEATGQQLEVGEG